MDVKRGAVDLGAFLVVFTLLWIIFDNWVLALFFAFLFAGGADVAQSRKDS